MREQGHKKTGGLASESLVLDNLSPSIYCIALSMQLNLTMLLFLL